MEFEFLAKHNPWWKSREELLHDRKVSIALGKKAAYIPSLVGEKKGICSIRGPRQVGKTTALKLLIWESVFKHGADARQFLYLPCDVLADFNEIVKAAELHKEWLLRFNIKENYVIFDEITFVKEWFRAIKYLADSSLCTLLVFTGSVASDLKHGTERFPGRGVKTMFYLPLSFSDYVRLFGSGDLKKELAALNPLSMEEAFSDALLQKAAYIIPFLGELNRHMDNYLISGGFLSSGYQFNETGAITEELYEDYVNWILGDLSKLEKSEHIFREIISVLASKYGAELAFHSIAKATSIGSHKTVAEYLELLESLMLLNFVHKIDLNKKAPVFRKQKKFYFLDTFLFSAFSGYVNGKHECCINELNKPFAIEGIVLEHLKRKANRLLESVWYYRDRKGEVDFVVRKGKRFQAVEVKWQEKVSESDFSHYNIFKAPLILSKTTMHNGKAVIMPAAVFLALI
ncbi:MAG: ATP-binding protein [Nanoarchaeota archaeon]|nr:ATP-binding protein [Nanoarchaeota archaeon]